MPLKKLFGGAITVDIPSGYLDASYIRQVPDTQEVYVALENNTSFIVEVLERVDRSDPYEAAKFHFDALAEDNDALSSTVSTSYTIPNDLTPSAIVLEGEQLVRKGSRAAETVAPEAVCILLALFRIPEKCVDLVASANIPTTSDGVLIPPAEIAFTREQFTTLVKSLRIEDFNLFA